VIVPHVPRKGFYLATRFFSSCCFCSFSFSSCIILFVAAPSSFPFLRLCAFELSVSSQTLLKACRTQTTRTLKKKNVANLGLGLFQMFVRSFGDNLQPVFSDRSTWQAFCSCGCRARFWHKDLELQSGAILFRDFLVYRQQCAQMRTPRTPIFIRSRNFKKILLKGLSVLFSGQILKPLGVRAMKFSRATWEDSQFETIC